MKQENAPTEEVEAFARVVRFLLAYYEEVLRRKKATPERVDVCV